MSVFLLAMVGIFFPIISFIAAVYLFLTGEIALGAFFFLWWIIWDDEDEDRNT